ISPRRFARRLRPIASTNRRSRRSSRGFASSRRTPCSPSATIRFHGSAVFSPRRPCRSRMQARLPSSAPGTSGQLCWFADAGTRLATSTLVRRVALLGLLLFPASVAGPPAHGPIRCGVEMRNVGLHLADGVVLGIVSLNGEFVSRSAAEPPIFDAPDSYTLRMKSADASMDAASLTTLLQQRLSQNASPLSGVKITFDEGRLRAAGTLHKGVSVPFSMTATVSATPDGLLRLHAEHVPAVGVPVKGLLDRVGLDVASLMKMPPGSGIRADKDDLLLDTALMLPPPRTEARMISAAISGGRLRMTMTGPAQPPARPATLP